MKFATAKLRITGVPLPMTWSFAGARMDREGPAAATEGLVSASRKVPKRTVSPSVAA